MLKIKPLLSLLGFLLLVSPLVEARSPLEGAPVVYVNNKSSFDVAVTVAFKKGSKSSKKIDQEEIREVVHPSDPSSHITRTDSIVPKKHKTGYLAGGQGDSISFSVENPYSMSEEEKEPRPKTFAYQVLKVTASWEEKGQKGHGAGWLYEIRDDKSVVEGIYASMTEADMDQLLEKYNEIIVRRETQI